jgi:uncharacterized membrane protein YphA (DoxX/SURF4 family)
MNVAVWIVQILLALGFFMSGLMKVAQPKVMFDHGRVPARPDVAVRTA